VTRPLDPGRFPLCRWATRFRNLIPRLRRLPFFLAYAILITPPTLLLLEVGVRLCLPRYERFTTAPIFVPQASGCEIGPPGEVVDHRSPADAATASYVFNRHGFRDCKDVALSRPGDWFVVGDSYGFGWLVGEEERFSNRIDASLEHAVYNICIPGDLVDYAGLMRHAESKGAAVDKIIVSVCMENDIRVYSPKERREPSRGPRTVAHAPMRWLKVFFARSVAWEAFEDARYNVDAGRRRIGRRIHSWAAARGLADPAPPGPETNEYRKRAVASSADRLVRTIAGRDALVVLVPSRQLWIGRKARLERGTHERFARALLARGFEVVDMLPRMEGDGHALRYYYGFDGHWNAAGHARAAEAILAFFGDATGSSGDTIRN
jgi:hypothetical protein